MKKMSLYLVLAFIVIFSGTMLVLAHKGKSSQTPVRVNPAFREYVQGFTSGIVSTRTAVKVRLADNFSDTATLNTPVASTYFKFNPAIKGKTYWSDSRTLVFQPDDKLPQDQGYTVEFCLSRLLTVPDSLKTLEFQFRTMKQEFSVEVDNHKAYSHVTLAREHLNGSVQTSDVADDQQVEKILSASQHGKDLPMVWTHDQKKRIHFFQVDSVARGKDASEVKLVWDGAPIDSKTDGKTIVEIPPVDNFKVLSVSSYPNTQQCWRVQFSDPLRPDQNLDGLFRVGKYNNVRYTVEDNLLWIYLPETENTKLSPVSYTHLTLPTKRIV